MGASTVHYRVAFRSQHFLLAPANGIAMIFTGEGGATSLAQAPLSKDSLDELPLRSIWRSGTGRELDHLSRFRTRPRQSPGARRAVFPA